MTPATVLLVELAERICGARCAPGPAATTWPRGSAATNSCLLLRTATLRREPPCGRAGAAADLHALRRGPGRRAARGDGQHRRHRLPATTAPTARRCCATPIRRCTAPSRPAATATCSSTPSTTAAPRTASSRSAAFRRRWTPSEFMPALPAQGRHAAAAACSASRRCCAGTTREHGLVPPGQFLPLIEHTGLGIARGRLGAGAGHLDSWRRGSATGWTSPSASTSRRATCRSRPSRDDLAELLAASTAAAVARHLVLEVLETAALADIDYTCGLMAALPRARRALCARRLRHRLLDASPT